MWKKIHHNFFYILKLISVLLITKISHENEGEYILKKKSKTDTIAGKDAHKTIYILSHYKMYILFCNINT